MIPSKDLTSVIRSGLPLLLLFSLSACASKIQRIEGLTEGLEKTDVLAAVGGPQISKRWQGKDRWIYRLYADGATQIREVHFDRGVLVYAGPPLPVAIPAAEQDRLNQQAHLEGEEYEKALREERRRFLETFDQPQLGSSEELPRVPVFVEI